MPRSTSCLFHSAQPTRKLHLFAVTCMSRSLPVFIFCIYCVPIQKLGRSLFILSRTFRFNEIGAKPNRHVGATDLWLVESRSSNKNAHNKTADGQMVQILLQLQNWFLAYDQTDTFPSNKNNHDKKDVFTENRCWCAKDVGTKLRQNSGGAIISNILFILSILFALSVSIYTNCKTRIFLKNGVQRIHSESSLGTSPSKKMEIVSYREMWK